MFCFGHTFIDYVFEAWLPLAPSKTSGACHFIAHRVRFSYRSKADQIQQANQCRICYRGKSEIISCGPLTVLLAQQAVNLIYDIVWICFSAILSFRVSALTCLRICLLFTITTHKSYQRPMRSPRIISEDICKNPSSHRQGRRD